MDHWESVIIEGDSWRYLVPTSQPDASWNNSTFDDTSWTTGNSGFGYDDGDDNVILPTGTISVYLRKTFTVLDKSIIDEVLLHMDYDDGFVAYLNGNEIARSLVSGSPPPFNQLADEWHEAVLYQNIEPEKFSINASLLNEGDNILAIQVHNQSATSSDMSAIPVLSLGINNTSFSYRSPPSWFTAPVNSPSDFSESNLPIFVFNTNGRTIVDEPKVDAQVGIIYNGEGVINKLTDPFNEYDGLCGIEFRGESSLSFDKKSYGFETRDALGNDLDTAFLDFPPEEDFILHGPYSDKTLLNNVLAMKLANGMGHYSSRTRMVELVINNNYLGVYVLMEKIKRDADRVDVSKLKKDEITGDDLTGGYIFRIDKGIYDGWSSKYDIYGGPGRKIFFQYYYPNEDDIQAEQKNYIQGYVDNFEDAIASSSFSNAAGVRYDQYINLRSFVDNFILNELSKDVDAYRLSTYFHKDKDSKGGKITAGPFWDFNLAFGNGDYCSGDDVTGWQYYQCVGNSPFWWDRMLQDPYFTNALKCRWEALRTDLLNTTTVENYLDSMATSLEQAQARNFDRWQILGSYIWPNPYYFSQAQSHAEVMFEMKRWIRERSEWLDANIPGVAQDCDLYDELDNEAPNILGVNLELNTPEDTPFSLLLSDLEVEDSDSSFPDDFSLSILDGQNYTVEGNNITPSLDFNGTLSITIFINDGIDDSETYEFSLEVTPVNDPPKLLGIISTISTFTDTPVAILLSNLVVEDSDNTFPDGFTLNIEIGQNYSIVGNAIVPAIGFSGTLTVPISVNDGSNNSETLNLSIAVNEVINYPTIASVNSQLSTIEEVPVLISIDNLVVIDPDHVFPDDFTLAINEGENYSIDGTQIIPDLNYTGLLVVPVYVNNGTDNSNIYDLLIEVSSVNDPPVLTGTTISETPEDTPISLSINDLSIQDPDNTFPNDFSLTINDEENYSVDGLMITPDKNFNGTLTVPLTVSDGDAESDSFELSLLVTPVNDIPEIVRTKSQLETSNQTPLTLSLSDIEVEDPDNTYPDDFSLVIHPGNDYSVNGKMIVPDQGYAGRITVPLQVNDGNDFSLRFQASIDVIVVAGLNNANNFDPVSIFPNPLDSEINMKGVKHFDEVILTNIHGQVIIREFIKTDQVNIRLGRKLSTGTYILRLISEHAAESRRIIIH